MWGTAMHGITIGTLNHKWAPLHGLSGRSVLRFMVTGTKGRGGSRGRGACGVVSGAGLHVLGLPYGIRDMRTLLFCVHTVLLGNQLGRRSSASEMA